MITEIQIYIYFITIIIIILLFTDTWRTCSLMTQGSYFSQGVPDLLLVD